MKKFGMVLVALCLLITAVMGVFSVSADAVLYGDINGDGSINNKDMGRLQQYLNGWDVTVNEAAADVNDDGKVNNKDMGRLQQYLNGWDVTLGPDTPFVPGDDNIFNDTELDWT